MLKKAGVEPTKDSDGINTKILITRKNGKAGVAGCKINMEKGVSKC